MKYENPKSTLIKRMGSSYSSDWFKEDVLPKLIQHKNDYERGLNTEFPLLPTSDVTVLLSYITKVIYDIVEEAGFLEDVTNEDIHDLQLAIDQFLPDEFHIKIDPEHVGALDEDRQWFGRIEDLEVRIFQYNTSMLENLERAQYIPLIADNPSIDDVDYITSEITSYFHPPPPPPPPRSRRRLPSTPTSVLYERQRNQRNLGPRYS